MWRKGGSLMCAGQGTSNEPSGLSLRHREQRPSRPSKAPGLHGRRRPRMPARRCSRSCPSAADGNQKREPPLPATSLIYTASEALMRPRVVPHTRPPNRQTNGFGGAKIACEKPACGGNRRRWSDRSDVAGELALAGADVASSSGAPARTSPARAQVVCSRAPSRSSISAESPWFLSEGQVPRSGHSPGPRWTSATFPPASLQARALAEPHRAHTGRLGRRAGGDDLPRT